VKEIRQVGAADNLTVCQLLPVEGLLLWALRAWCYQAACALERTHAPRWQLQAAFQRFGIATQFETFELGMRRMTCASAAAVPDFHGLDCLCVGQSERRWLQALGALQRGSRDAATDALARVICRDEVPSVLVAFEPLAAALGTIGWMLPPWNEASTSLVTPCAHAPESRPSLRLIVSRP